MRYVGGVIRLLVGAAMMFDGNNGGGWFFCLLGLAALGVVNLNSDNT